MPFLADWLTVFLVGCLAVMSPGPNLAVTLRNSLSYSRRAGIYTALGLAAGNTVHAAYSLAGIGLVIAQSVVLFNVIKWAGAAYLVWIGVQALRAQPRAETPDLSGTADDLSASTAFRTGLFTNLLNPKVTLFFLALFTQVVEPGTPLALQALYGGTIVGLEFAWFGLVAVVLSQGAVRRRFFAVSHWVDRATGAALIALGVRLAFAKASE